MARGGDGGGHSSPGQNVAPEGCATRVRVLAEDGLGHLHEALRRRASLRQRPVSLLQSINQSIMHSWIHSSICSFVCSFYQKLRDELRERERVS